VVLTGCGITAEEVLVWRANNLASRRWASSNKLCLVRARVPREEVVIPDLAFVPDLVFISDFVGWALGPVLTSNLGVLTRVTLGLVGFLTHNE
jgi:hypothetical protein